MALDKLDRPAFPAPGSLLDLRHQLPGDPAHDAAQRIRRWRRRGQLVVIAIHAQPMLLAAMGACERGRVGAWRGVSVADRARLAGNAYTGQVLNTCKMPIHPMRGCPADLRAIPRRPTVSWVRGEPYIDAEPFESKGTMSFTDTERARYDAEEARYKAAHGACGSYRHSVAGSMTMHCGTCCPSPQPSPAQLAKLSTLMSRKKPRTN